MPSIEAMKEARREQLEREAANGLNASSAVGATIIHQILPVVTEEIRSRVNTVKHNKGIPAPIWFFSVNELKPEIVAYLALRSVIGLLIQCGGSGPVRQQLLYRTVGRAVIEEAVLKNKSKHDDAVKQRLKKLASTRDSAESKEALARKLFNLSSYVEATECIAIGATLVSCIEHVTNVIEQEKITVRRGHRLMFNTIYRLNTQTLDWIEDFQRRAPEYRPMLMPMDTPPIDWTSASGGGYGPDMGLNAKLLLNFTDPAQADAIGPSKYLDAVNIAQRTAWMINENVLEVAEALWSKGIPIAGIPAKERPPMSPPFPEDGDEDTKRAWKREAVHRIEAEYSRITGCALFGRQLTFARTYIGDGKFWFPGSLDFRGRFYYRGALSVQGDDFQRGLLCFADARPIGSPDGVRWLKIHIANCFGVDKVSFDERLKWFSDNEKNILASAEDPVENVWWAEADCPWQFLAAILDYWGFLQDGYSYVSRVPIGMDGSNNGLQLYSLLTGDKALAESTNVRPTQKPNDIYRNVAARVTTTIRNSLRPPEAEAGVSWIMETLFPDGIPRGVTKRPVMTLAYGVTQFSSRKYVLESINDECRKRGLKMPLCNQYAALQFVGDQVWHGLQEGADSAVACMRWISSCVEAVAKKTKKPVVWVSPSGFPVHHWYPKETSRYFKTSLGVGFAIKQIACFEKTDDPNVKTMASAAPPNFIHSLDAAVLVETVLGCYSRGVESFALVHDSFGVCAADAAILAEEIRQAVVRVFKSDPLESFAKSIELQLGEPIERFKCLNEFPVSDVLQSEYIFA